MPVVPVVMGVATIAGGGGMAALWGATMAGGLSGLAAGATLLGGIAQVAGGLKGGAEGQKWAATGGLLSLGGAIGGGMEAGKKVAETAAKDSAAGVQAATQAPGSVTGELVNNGGVALPSSPTTTVQNAPFSANPAMPTATQTVAARPAGMLSSGVDPNVLNTTANINSAVNPQIEAARILADQQQKATYLQLGGGMLQGYGQEQQLKDAYAQRDREFARTQYRSPNVNPL